MSAPPDPRPPAPDLETFLAGIPPAARLLLGVLLIIGAVAELFLTWLLVEHAPWLGWPLAILSVAAVIYAVYHRWGRRRG